MPSMLKLSAWITCLLVAGTGAVFGGTNEGFQIELSQNEIIVDEGDVGEAFKIEVSAMGVSAAKQSRLDLVYDPEVIGEVNLVAGTLIPSIITFTEGPVVEADGMAKISIGGAQLGEQIAPGEGDGLLYSVAFVLKKEAPDEGTTVSVEAVKVGRSFDDADELFFPAGAFGITLRPDLPNQLSRLNVEAGFKRALISWQSRFRGYADVVRYRVVGTEEWTVEERLVGRNMIDAARVLLGADIDLQVIGLPRVRRLLDDNQLELSDEGLRRLIPFVINLQNRRHVVTLAGLEPDTKYEFEAVSLGFGGENSPRLHGYFSTRTRPDLRPFQVFNFDLQAGYAGVSGRWFTNLLAKTHYTITKVGFAVNAEDQPISVDGGFIHAFSVKDLDPATEYKLTVVSELVGAEELVSGGFITAESAVIVRQTTFHTKGFDRPLRLAGLPGRLVDGTSALIAFNFNQVASAVVEYGPIGQEDYPYSIASPFLLKRHAVRITDLVHRTRYRYRIKGVTLAGEEFVMEGPGLIFTFSTWSAEPPGPPAIVLGPRVVAASTKALFALATDVPTLARVYVGTAGGTFRTADELVFVDQLPNGDPRFSRLHLIPASGFERGNSYNFRIEVTRLDGQTTVFDPTAGSGKIAAALQGVIGGTFDTSDQLDTQAPIILSGPTVVARTHNSAIVEWTTNEPADSEVSFGVGTLDDEVTSGDQVVNHQVVLTDLTPGETYTYFVGSTDLEGNGVTESAQAVFTTLDQLDLTPPAFATAPAVAYQNDNIAVIRWNTDEAATSQVEFGTSESLGFARDGLQLGTEHEVVLTNLEANTTYYVKATSVDLSGNGPTQSTVFSFTTDSDPDLVAPQISAVEVVPSEDLAIVRWNTNELADSYINFGIVEGVLGSSYSSIDDVSEHELVLTNLAPSTTYYYVVGSVDKADNAAVSPEVMSFTTLGAADLTPPLAPVGLSGIVGLSQVVLSWTANSDGDLAGYNIYRRVEGGEFIPIATRVQQNSYTDVGLSPGVSYEYQITAIDRNLVPNESEASPVMGFVPSASAAPSVPGDLRSEGEALLPTLVFSNATPFTVGADLTYSVHVSTQADFSDVVASVYGLAEGSGGLGTGLTAWTVDVPLQEGITYYWRVQALEGVLGGPFSEGMTYLIEAAPLLVGDFNGDNAVGFDDFFLFVDFFGQAAVDGAVAFDLDTDGTIGFGDFFLFVDNFGLSVAGKEIVADRPVDETVSLALEAVGGTRDVGQVVRVRVLADGLVASDAIGFALDYDPNVVQFDQAEPGALNTSLFGVLGQTPGQIMVGSGLSAEAGSAGLVAELQFRAVGPLNQAHFELRQALVGAGNDVRQVVRLQDTRLLPKNFQLSANFPNPFNPSTTIEYALPSAGPVQLHIYDVLGRKVQTLVNQGTQAAGIYSAVWDGTDAQGRAVGNGVYFYRLEATGFTKTNKMLLVK